MRKSLLPVVLAATLAVTGCASIPPEAPELSAQLGTRISSLEAAHVRLLREFFVEKRRRVDEFVQEVWVPLFAQEFFSDPRIDAVWQQVVESRDPNDRVKFISLVGPKLQDKINKKRVELVQPLDEIEATIRGRLTAEYDQVRAINNTLTSFLHSASKVEENRQRYLGMLGITDTAIESFIGKTDEAVTELVDATRSVDDIATDAEKYRETLKDILAHIRK